MGRNSELVSIMEDNLPAPEVLLANVRQGLYVQLGPRASAFHDRPSGT